jgi:glycerophosphoryl diester phosphodiesterase
LGPSPHPFLDVDGPIAFAHRGGLSVAPENTMAAFQDAVSLGYTHVETDVHVTSDGILVAFHDDGLLRTCGIDASIEQTPWSELKDARVDGREPIPLLEDILATWPGLRVNIDCKTADAEDALIATLVRLDCLDRVCVGSFSDRRLRRFRSHFGEALCTSTGPREVASLVLASRTRHTLARTGPARAAQVPVSQGPVPVVTRAFVSCAHRLGLQVHVWTVDDPAEIARLLDTGVDGIMSDDTRALRDVFTARGLWR